MSNARPSAPEQAERLIGLLGAEDVPDEVLEIMYSLAALGEPAVPSLLSAMLDTNRLSILRQRVIGMFPDFIEDARAVLPIISLLRDADAEVRWSAVHSLENMREESALPGLEYLAAYDKSVFPDADFQSSVSEAAAEAIKQIRSGQKLRYKYQGA